MNRAFQTIDCRIAGKSVTAARRSGRAFLEQGAPYIRCSERDCQYVDQNRPPCPLRMEMFDNEAEYTMLRQYFETASPQRLCYLCLAERFNLTHDSVRRAAARLNHEHGAVIGPGRCAGCHCRRTILFMRKAAIPADTPTADGAVPHHSVPPVSFDANTERRRAARVGVAVNRADDRALCGACLAFANGVSLADIRQIVDNLLKAGSVAISRDSCAHCQRYTTVIRQSS